jgi:very-short-patch-repair endonuclease
VFDLAATCHPARLERLLDWFWNERLLDGATLDRTVRELARRGRTGSTLMRELAATRGAGYVPPASTLERRFEQVLEQHLVPSMRRQVDSGGESWSGRVDFRHRSLPLVVEVHSEKHHTSLVDRADDARRRRALEDDGLEVVIVWDYEVWHEPGVVADRVRASERKVQARKAG